MSQALFLTFEGIDGSGKSTQLALLAQKFRTEGRDVVETVEPGGTEIGRAIRAILLDARNNALSPEAELLLYFASRAQNVAETIRPALARGATVLCDRFTDSTLVYQGAGRGLDPAPIRHLHHMACGDLQPDLTLLLDIDLETSLARARHRTLSNGNAETRIEDESRDFFRRVRDSYLALAAAEPDRIRLIDGRGSKEEVSARIWSEVTVRV